MENNAMTVASATTQTTNTQKTPCGCGGTQEPTHGGDDCPCKRRAKIKKMVIGGVILIVLGVAAYGAYRMGYFEKAMAFLKTKIKRIG